MIKTWYRVFRGFVLGTMVLLAGAANLVCISYDNDGDEDTPSVTIELNVVAPTRRAVHSPLKHSGRVHLRSFSATEQSTPRLMAAIDRESKIQADPGSPQFAVPLRR
jgi:hypothetical protein